MRCVECFLSYKMVIIVVACNFFFLYDVILNFFLCYKSNRACLARVLAAFAVGAIGSSGGRVTI